MKNVKLHCLNSEYWIYAEYSDFLSRNEAVGLQLVHDSVEIVILPNSD